MFKTHVLFTRTLLCRSRTWCLWHFPKCNFQFQSAPTSRYFIFNSFFLNFDFQTSPNIFWKTLPVQSVQAPHVLPSFRNWHSNSSLKLRVVHTYSWKRWQHLTERFTTFFKRRSYQSMLDGWCFVSFVKWNCQRTSRYIFLDCWLHQMAPRSPLQRPYFSTSWSHKKLKRRCIGRHFFPARASFF